MHAKPIIDLISKLSIIYGLSSTNVFANSEQCMPDSLWLNPASMQSVASSDVFSQLNQNPILLMGEHHANANHHSWHLDTLTKLSRDNNNIVLGFEMLPRSKQDLLNRWVAGKLNQKEFLRMLNWDELWGFDLNHYLPLFLFARDKKIPIVALNIEQALVKNIANRDWSKTDFSLYPITKPANPPPEYIRQLAVSFTRHKFEPLSESDKEKFHRFVKQQLIWDRVMAESIVKSIDNSSNVLFIGFAGSWHLINRFGIVFQLNSLGHNEITTLIPWDKNLDCSDLNSTFANYIYVSE